MLPISSGADMNSRATGQRSHKRRIGLREAVSDRDGMIEAGDQGEQRRVGHRFIPVIESGAERLLALHDADDGAEDDRHPQQRGKAMLTSVARAHLAKLDRVAALEIADGVTAGEGKRSDLVMAWVKRLQ